MDMVILSLLPAFFVNFNYLTAVFLLFFVAYMIRGIAR